MTSIELAKAYFDVWNARDADAIVATFIESGSYGDIRQPMGGFRVKR